MEVARLILGPTLISRHCLHTLWVSSIFIENVFLTILVQYSVHSFKMFETIILTSIELIEQVVMCM